MKNLNKAALIRNSFFCGFIFFISCETFAFLPTYLWVPVNKIYNSLCAVVSFSYLNSFRVFFFNKPSKVVKESNETESGYVSCNVVGEEKREELFSSLMILPEEIRKVIFLYANEKVKEKRYWKSGQEEEEKIKKKVPFGYSSEDFLCFYSNKKTFPLINIKSTNSQKYTPQFPYDFALDDEKPLEFVYDNYYPPKTDNPYCVSPDQCMIAGPNEEGFSLVLIKKQLGEPKDIVKDRLAVVERKFFDLDRISKRYTWWGKLLPFCYKGDTINLPIRYVLALHDKYNKILYIDDNFKWGVADLDRHGKVVTKKVFDIDKKGTYRPFLDKAVFVGKKHFCAFFNSTLFFYDHQAGKMIKEIDMEALSNVCDSQRRKIYFYIDYLNHYGGFSQDVIVQCTGGMEKAIGKEEKECLKKAEKDDICRPSIMKRYAVAVSMNNSKLSLLDSRIAVEGSPRYIHESAGCYSSKIFSEDYVDFSFKGQLNSLYMDHRGRRHVTLFRDTAPLQDRRYAEQYVDILDLLSPHRHFEQMVLIKRACKWLDGKEKNEGLAIMEKFLDKSIIYPHERMRLIASSGEWRHGEDNKWVWKAGSSPFTQIYKEYPNESRALLNKEMGA